MNTVQRIRNLCSNQGITVAELERRIGLSNGQISKWNKQKPGVDKVSKVADYFNVSIDYLLGRNEDDFSGEERSKEFRSLQRLARNMTDEEAKKAYQLLELAFEIEDDEEDDI